MVDLSKFSADVRSRIENIMATKVEDGGGKDSQRIDSNKEYQELGKLLSGDGKVSGKQKELVEGMLTEYEDNFMVRDEVKQRVKDLVKNGNANQADDNAEINDLKNYKKTKGLSKEEKAFIQRVIDGKEVEASKNAMQGETKTEAKTEKVETNAKTTDTKTENNNTPPKPNEVEEKRNPVTPEASSETKPNEKQPAKPKSNGGGVRKKPRHKPFPKNKGWDKDSPKFPTEPKPSEPPKTDKPVNPTEKTPAPAKPKSAPKPHITESGRNKGIKLARDVQAQVHSSYADNEEIKIALNKVDETSAYSFVGQFRQRAGHGVNQEVFSVRDLFGKINYRDTLHVMKKLLQQAKNMGLESNPAYKALAEEVKYGEKAFTRRTEVDPNKNTQIKADQNINWLYNEMSRAMQRAGN